MVGVNAGSAGAKLTLVGMLAKGLNGPDFCVEYFAFVYQKTTE